MADCFFLDLFAYLAFIPHSGTAMAKSKAQPARR